MTQVYPPSTESMSVARRIVIQTKDRIEAMEAALKAVEWTELRYAPYESMACPWCGNFKDEGHKPDCQRQAALGLSAKNADS
jgi:hypothetical protein